MRVIIDTSTLIAMLLSSHKKNNTHIILALSNKKIINFVVANETLRELKTAITSKKYKNHPNYNARRTAEFINRYQHTALMYKLTPVKLPNIRDENDAIFLQLASISKAHYLISGDKDLLEVKNVGDTRILKPAEFLKEYLKTRNLKLI